MTEMPELHPVFAKQIDCMMRDDKKGLMEIYHPEVESLRFQGVLKGREAISDLLVKYEELKPEFVKVLEYVHSEDMIMTRWTNGKMLEIKYDDKGPYVDIDEKTKKYIDKKNLALM